MLTGSAGTAAPLLRVRAALVLSVDDKRHLHHAVAGTVAALACARLTFPSGKFACASERLQIGHQIPRALQRSIGTAVEQPRIRRHHRISHHRARREEVREVPVAPDRSRARQVRPDPPRAPEVGIEFVSHASVGAPNRRMSAWTNRICCV